MKQLLEALLKTIANISNFIHPEFSHSFNKKIVNNYHFHITNTTSPEIIKRKRSSFLVSKPKKQMKISAIKKKIARPKSKFLGLLRG